mgnify:CR=1 FL=1
MPTLYKVPLEIDPNEIKAFDMVEAIERHSVSIECPEGVDHVNVTGTIETLADFFSYLDGPAQSFPIDEFVEWVQDYKVVQ